MADIRGSMRATGERLASAPTRMHQKIVPSSDWTEDSNGHYLLVDLPDFRKEEVRVEVNMSAGHITIGGERQVNDRTSEYFKQIFTLWPNSDVDNITGKFDGEILYVTVPKKAAAVEEQKKEPEIENENVQGGTTAAMEPPQVEKNENVQGTSSATAAMEAPHVEKNENVQGGTAAAMEPPQVEKNENVKGLRPKNEGGHLKKVDDVKYWEMKKLLGNENIFFSPENIRKWEEEGGNIVKKAMEMLSKNKGIVITAVVAFSLGMQVSRKFQSAGE